MISDWVLITIAFAPFVVAALGLLLYVIIEIRHGLGSSDAFWIGLMRLTGIVTVRNATGAAFRALGRKITGCIASTVAVPRSSLFGWTDAVVRAGQGGVGQNLNNRRILRIADFSVCPGGLTDRDGPSCAQRFREDYLVPALAEAISNDAKLWVDIRDVAGLPHNWLKHSFGRFDEYGISRQDAGAHLELESNRRDSNSAMTIRNAIARGLEAER